SLGVAEQEQRLGEVDGSTVDVVQALDELGGVAVGILAGNVEQRLRDRERCAQFMGGVRSESPLLGRDSRLFGDVCFELGEHRVEGIGKLAKLVVTALEVDSVGERSGRGD